MENKYDVCIVGGGTGGCAAAFAFLGKKKKVLLIESQEKLGGVACMSGVDSWIEGYNSPVVERMYRTLLKVDKVKGDYDKSWVPERFSCQEISSKLLFDCEALSEFYYTELSKGGIDIRLETEMTKVISDQRRIKSITVKYKSSVEEEIFADYFIDATTDAKIITSCGIVDKDYEFGRDPKEKYNESIANIEKGRNFLNEPSILFSIVKGKNDDDVLKEITTVYEKDGKVIKPDYIRDTGYKMYSVGGVKKMNPMYGAGIQGYYRLEYGAEREKEILVKRTLEYWKYKKLLDLKKKAASNSGDCISDYGFEKFYSVGVRESFRVKCEVMLNQNDLSKRVEYKDDVIAIGSHPIDFHVKDGFNMEQIQEFNETQLRPYGIKFGSIIPINYDNCLIASKCFGASQIANASARISKVINQIGWCAGNIILYCIRNKIEDVRKINLKDVKGKDYIDFEERYKYFIEQCS